MIHERQLRSGLSSALVEHLLKTSGTTQEKIATALGVSPAFVSRVRSGERSFTIDHLLLVEELLDQPIGAILLAIRKARPSDDPALARLQKLAQDGLEKADKLRTVIRKRRAATHA